MSRIRPSWTPVPTGNAGAYVFGFDLTVDTTTTASGVWWYQPSGGAVTNVQGRLYDQAGQTLLASGTVLAASIVQGSWNYIPFSAGYVMSAAVTYTAAAAISGEHAYEDPAGYPITAPAGHVTSSTGRYQSGTGYPATTWSGQHGVDLEFDLSVTVTLTPATLTLTAQALTATPGPVSTALTPAVMTLAPQPLTATPGMVTVTLTPVVMTLTAQPLSVADSTAGRMWAVSAPHAKWHAFPPQL